MTKLTTKFFGAVAVSLLMVTPALAGKKTTANAPTPSAVAAALTAATGVSVTVSQNASGDYTVTTTGGVVVGTFNSNVVAFYINAYNNS